MVVINEYERVVQITDPENWEVSSVLEPSQAASFFFEASSNKANRIAR